MYLDILDALLRRNIKAFYNLELRDEFYIYINLVKCKIINSSSRMEGVT